MKLVLATLALVVALALPATGETIVRDGAQFSGIANPGGCSIFVHDGSTELHVNCRDASAPARVRYRYTGEVHGPAVFTAVVEPHGAAQICRAGNTIRWMDPTPRTGRVLIEKGCYAHIVSVEWAR